MFASLIDPADRVNAEMLYNPSLRAVSGWNLNLANTERRALVFVSVVVRSTGP
jgi:hypothetical protein